MTRIVAKQQSQSNALPPGKARKALRSDTPRSQIRIRVLILEDSKADAELMIRALEQSGMLSEWERVETEPDFTARLTPAPDLILSDYALPHFSGIQALRLVRSRGLDVPFILVSGSIGEDVAVEAMREGADDYLLKDRMARLGPAVLQILEKKQLRTEKERAEAALNANEALYRGIFEGAAEGILLSTLDGYLLAANPAAAQMLGYGLPEELVSSVTNPGHRLYADPDARRALIERVKQEGEVRGYETRGLRKDGTPLWVTLSARLVRDPGSGMSRILTMIADISERRRSEEVRAKLVAIVEYSNDAIISRTLDGTITSWNGGAERMFGYAAEEAIGQPITILLPPGVPSRLDRNNETVRSGHIVEPFESQRATRDGGILDVLVSVSPVRDPAGGVTGASAIFHDISVLKRAEAALKESEERFRAAFEQAGVGMALRGIEPRNSRWLRVNQKLCDILGYTKEELLQLTSVDITPPEDRELAVDYNEKLLKGELTTYSREKRYLCKDGGIIWANITLTAVSGPDGRRSHVISVIEDITERKLQQEKIEKLLRTRAVSSGISATLVRVRDRQELLQESCRIAVEDGQFPFVWIGLLDPATLDVTPVAWSGAGSDELTRAKSSARNDTQRGMGAVGHAIRERRAVINNDIAAKQFGGPRIKEILKLGFRSQITLPLFVDETVIGTLTLYAREPNFFDQEELKLLTELAGDISFALENISKQQKLDKLARIRAVSSETNAAIVRFRDREALLREICRIAAEHGKFEMVWVATVDQAKQLIRPVAWTGFTSETANAVRWASLGAPGVTLSEVFRTRRLAVRNDIESEQPTGILRQEALNKGYRSTVCLPFVVDGEVVATMILFAAGRNFFVEDELALLGEGAVNISIALERMARQEKIDKLSRVRAVSSEINAAIVRIRDRGELFTEACRIAVEHGKFVMAWIGTLDEATQSIRAVAKAGREEGYLERINLTIDPDTTKNLALAVEAVARRALVVCNDISTDGRMRPWRSAALERGYRANAMLPLLLGQRVIGIFGLYAPEPGFFDSEELSLLIELAGDVSFALDHIEKQERLDYLAYYDTLTGLPNRTLFVDRAGQQMRTRAGEPLMTALILLDLERFRNINESFGRHGGDELLKQVARRLEIAFNGKDYLARVGADIFGIVIRGIRDAAAAVHAVENQVLGCFREPFQVGDSEPRVVARAGIALHPADGGDADTLFSNAEAALKKAGDSGEHYLFYATDMNARAAQMLSLETRLRKAVEAQQFVLHYQPKINLSNDGICGLEALIRWNDPESGLVPPGTFIPLLEETGLILEVGKWALVQALTDHREWTARGCTVPAIAVNISAIQLQRPDFTETIIGVLQQRGGKPEALELEITESLLMKDVEASIRKLSILRGLGIHVAMDDFGTGYSSLSYIARLPITSVKIDRSFINGMAKSPQDMGIVTTIIALAHSLNLRVVAEGVETGEQSQLLKLLKCDEAQGYLFSKPLPAAEIEALLRERAPRLPAPSPGTGAI